MSKHECRPLGDCYSDPDHCIPSCDQTYGRQKEQLQAADKLAEAVKAGIGLIVSEYCSHPEPCGAANRRCYGSDLLEALAAYEKARGK